MDYYFEVTLNYVVGGVILTKAKDVIEAGKKVEEYYRSLGWDTAILAVTEVTRTKITHIVD